MMSMVSIVGVILAIGYVAVAIVGTVAWRRRMRESLPVRERVPVAHRLPVHDDVPAAHWRRAA